MPPSMEERLCLARVARGLEPADTLIRGGQVINVYSGEMLSLDVAVARGRIAYLRPPDLPQWPADRVLAADGCLLCPGYIEGHSHPWVIYNPLTLEDFALPLGTTSHIADNLPFFQYGGVDIFDKIVKIAATGTSRFYWVVRAIPQSALPDEKDTFSPQNIEMLLDLPQVVGIAEITRWKQMLEHTPSFVQKLAAAASRRKRIDGHTAGCNGEGLNALAALGISSCHEAISGTEALERLRLGLWVMVRNSSIRPDLESILGDLLKSGVSLERLILTTDAAEPAFLAKNGFMDGLLQVALQAGVDPLTAIKMVTLNPAVLYGLDEDVGGIAPGRYADILFLESLHKPSPALVMAGGQIVARQGRRAGRAPQIDWARCGFLSDFAAGASPWLQDAAFFKPRRGKVPVMEMVSSGITRLDYSEWDGCTLPAGLQYCCLLGRRGEYHHACFLRGFADDVRGLAASFTTSLGVLVIGDTLEAMQQAARRLYALKGGIILWEQDAPLMEIPLEIAGMMSPLPLPAVAEQLNRLSARMQARGFRHNDLMLALLFLSCDFLPHVKITPQGVLDVKSYEIIY